MKNFLSFEQIQQSLKSKKTTCKKIVEIYLKTIAEKNDIINAFIEVYTDESLERSKLIDQKISNGSSGKLAGMVIAIKILPRFAVLYSI